MENTTSDRLNAIADNSGLTAYVKGDVKKFTKLLESQGWEIDEVVHYQNYNGWAVAVTLYSGTTPEGEEFYGEEVNWG